MAPAAFEALLPETDELTRVRQCVVRGRVLADALPPKVFRSGAIVRLSRFATEPQIADLPGRRLLRSAANWAKVNRELEAAELVDWCQTLLDLMEACRGTARDADFLSALATTHFPVVLLWSNATLAREIFVQSERGIEIKASLLRNRKSRRKTVTTCLRYILGSFGRFGPRDAWIGAGFASTDGNEQPAVIDPKDEAIRIEPDIGWMARHWFGGDAPAILPGEDAWSHVGRCLRSHVVGVELVPTLESLSARAAQVTGCQWCYGDVDKFLHESETLLAQSVDDRTWRSDPHRWWLTRVLKRQIRLRPSVERDCERLYEDSRRCWLEGASNDTMQERARMEPLPLRVVRAMPSALIGYGEEFVDWVLKADAVRQCAPPFLPQDIVVPCAMVVHVEGDQARYKLHEPNLLRTAQGIGRHLDDKVDYLDCDPDVVAIAPPPDFRDQRLLRSAVPEMAVEQIARGTDAMFRSPLSGPRVEAQLNRELCSPRYRAVPDLLPSMHDEAAAQELSFGQLDATNRTIVLSVDAARALAVRLPDPGMVAAFYWLEISAALGCPRWVGALCEGKMSRFPTASSTVFHWLLHACRISRDPIVLSALRCSSLQPVLCDEQHRPLAAELYVAFNSPQSSAGGSPCTP